MRVFDIVSRDELDAVFEEWLVRLDADIQPGGEYVEFDESMKQDSIPQSPSY
jgi:hypothetical protein